VDTARAAEQQVKVARDQFIGSNRPRLMVRSISMEGAGAETRILYSIVNTGNSKCKLVDSFVMTEFVGEGASIRDLRAYQNKMLGEHEFEPGQYFDVYYQPPPDHLAYIEGGDFAGMAHGTLYFTGAFRYLDGLGNSRNAVFRRRFANHSFHRADNPDHEFSD
jgi:hypothetical protein